MKALVTSWKTTLAAFLLAGGALCQAISAAIDSNAATVPDWANFVTLLIIAVGLLFARDADKSSQDAGIRK
jgi:hypothetical protein